MNKHNATRILEHICKMKLVLTFNPGKEFKWNFLIIYVYHFHINQTQML